MPDDTADGYKISPDGVIEYFECSTCGKYKPLSDMVKVKADFSIFQIRKLLYGKTHKLICKDCIGDIANLVKNG